ncbi:MAG: PAS domain-containing sensor histidine kinase, partial [Marinilabiliales bacterium]
EKLFICNILNEISFHLEQQIIEEKDKNKLLEKKFSKKAELNELQSVFVSMAAHQFRTPLAGIISSVNLIIRYLAADQETWNRILNKNKIEEHFSKIKLSIKDLTDILNRFLSISKLEEGEIKHEPKNFILEDFINDFIKYSQSLLKPGQKLICNYENTNQCVYLDEELLKNCLLNIVSNAIKYSANQQNIYFSAIIENQNILISIKDEGIGIPKEEQKFLFRRFYRAKNAKTLTGTGLGLNIVKKYLDIMNGEISCISEKGKGARFTIKLKQICHE